MVNKLCRCYGWCNNVGKDKKKLIKRDAKVINFKLKSLKDEHA